jgi:xylulokinase
MGGVIQALWCLGKNPAGKAGDGNSAESGASIGDLTGEHVGIGGGRTIRPDPASMAAYDRAYAEYEKYLGALGPLYR